VELYRGSFLDNFDVGNCLAFEEWIIGRRAHLRVQFLDGLDAIITHWTRRGAYERALTYARRQLAQEPLSEKAHRQLMMLLALTGQRSAALAQYEICRRILVEALGLAPLEETTALYHTIQRSNVATSNDTAATPQRRPSAKIPFVGREKEHAALIEAWEGAHHSKGQLTLVAGEAGIGKTQLLEEVLRYTETQGATVLRGHCYEFGGSVPYQPIAEALRSYLHEEQLSLSPIWLSELARLLPDLHERHPGLPEAQRTTGDAARQRLFEAVARLLASICEKQSALNLFLDDLHWADQATLDLLHYLVRHLTDAPIWLVGTYRPEEVNLSHSLTRLRQGLSRDHRVVHLTLAPLSSASVRAAAQALVGEQEGSDLGDFLQRESEGNAFILVETISTLEEEDALVASDIRFQHDEEKQPTWIWTGKPSTKTLPLSVQDIILQRVGRLSDVAQQLLTLAAVVGQPFDAALLQAADLNADRVEDYMSEWLDRHIVCSQPSASSVQYDFSHDKIRAVVYQTTEPEKRQQLHYRVGKALEQRHAERVEEHAASLAYHFERAGDVEKALTYLPLAADHAAAVYANDQALDYYQRALTLCPTSDRRCWRILLQQADILTLIGEYNNAIEACQQVIDSGSADWQARAYGMLAQVYRIQRRYAAARRCIDESRRLTQIASRMQGIETPIQRARTLQTLGEIEREQTNLARAQELFEAALTIYQETEDTQGLAHCYKGLGDILSSRGSYRQARERYEQAVEIYEKLEDKQNAGVCLRCMGMASWRLREYAAARQAVLKGLEICQAIGDRHGEAAALNSLGLLAIVQEDHDETQRRLHASIKIYRELGLEKRTAPGLHNLGISYMESGDMTAARQCLEQALEIDRAVGSPHDQALDLGWLGKLHWLLKDYAAAADYLDHALALDSEMGGGEEEDWHLIWRVAVACESGNLSGAHRYLQRAEQMFMQDTANLNVYDINLWKASLRLAAGHAEAAQTLARQALHEARAAHADARTLGEILTLLGRSFGANAERHDEEARSHFEEALANLPDVVPTMYLRAMTLYHYGTYLAANGGQEQAKVYLKEAKTIFERIGMPIDFMR